MNSTDHPDQGLSRARVRGGPHTCGTGMLVIWHRKMISGQERKAGKGRGAWAQGGVGVVLLRFARDQKGSSWDQVARGPAVFLGISFSGLGAGRSQTQPVGLSLELLGRAGLPHRPWKEQVSSRVARQGKGSEAEARRSPEPALARFPGSSASC